MGASGFQVIRTGGFGFPIIKIVEIKARGADRGAVRHGPRAEASARLARTGRAPKGPDGCRMQPDDCHDGCRIQRRGFRRGTAACRPLERAGRPRRRGADVVDKAVELAQPARAVGIGRQGPLPGRRKGGAVGGDGGEGVADVAAPLADEDGAAEGQEGGEDRRGGGEVGAVGGEEAVVEGSSEERPQPEEAQPVHEPELARCHGPRCEGVGRRPRQGQGRRPRLAQGDVPGGNGGGGQRRVDSEPHEELPRDGDLGGPCETG